VSVTPLTSARRIARTSVRRRELEAGFWIVALSYLLVLAVGAIPSPLYGLYQHRDGFSTFTITLIFAAYTLGTTASLFLVGHISDWYGRKRVLIPGMAMSAASVLVLLLWRDLPGLYLGRIMGGLGVGAVSGTATAYVAELRAAAHPGGSPRLVQLVSAGVSLSGIGIGALVSGFLAQYVTAPLTVISAGIALNADVSTKDTLLGFAIAVAIALAATVPVLLRQASQPVVVAAQDAPESAPSLSSVLELIAKSGIRGPRLQHLTPQNKGENIMSTAPNRDLVVKALTELFVDGDPSALDRYWSGDDYIQHSPQIPNGVDGLRRFLTGTNVTYEIGFAAGTGDIVMVHGRFTGPTPKPLIAVDIFRVIDGKITEHWDVLQEEVTDTASGNPMFDPAEAGTSGIYVSTGR
jgi:MFS family permease